MRIHGGTDKYHIERCCAYCEKATTLANEDYVLCSRRGVVAQTFACRGFAYDPLKRIPKRLPKMPCAEDDK